MGETNGASTPLGDLNNINPGQVRPGGAPARVYLNEKIVPYLLDGMKSVAREQWVES
jgi:COMPASS component SDC1